MQIRKKAKKTIEIEKIVQTLRGLNNKVKKLKREIKEEGSKNVNNQKRKRRIKECVEEREEVEKEIKTWETMLRKTKRLDLGMGYPTIFLLVLMHEKRHGLEWFDARQCSLLKSVNHRTRFEFEDTWGEPNYCSIPKNLIMQDNIEPLSGKINEGDRVVHMKLNAYRPTRRKGFSVKLWRSLQSENFTKRWLNSTGGLAQPFECRVVFVVDTKTEGGDDGLSQRSVWYYLTPNTTEEVIAKLAESSSYFSTVMNGVRPENDIDVKDDRSSDNNHNPFIVEERRCLWKLPPNLLSTVDRVYSLINKLKYDIQAKKADSAPLTKLKQIIEALDKPQLLECVTGAIEEFDPTMHHPGNFHGAGYYETAINILEGVTNTVYKDYV